MELCEPKSAITKPARPKKKPNPQFQQQVIVIPTQNLVAPGRRYAQTQTLHMLNTQHTQIQRDQPPIIFPTTSDAMFWQRAEPNGKQATSTPRRVGAAQENKVKRRQGSAPTNTTVIKSHPRISATHSRNTALSSVRKPKHPRQFARHRRGGIAALRPPSKTKQAPKSRPGALVCIQQHFA